ncbi:MAG: hypothetical protein AAB316_13865, partial [Bacteroidota bacterium]
MNTTQCPVCQAEIPPGENWCAACGQPVLEPVTDAFRSRYNESLKKQRQFLKHLKQDGETKQLKASLSELKKAVAEKSAKLEALRDRRIDLAEQLKAAQEERSKMEYLREKCELYVDCRNMCDTFLKSFKPDKAV